MLALVVFFACVYMGVARWGGGGVECRGGEMAANGAGKALGGSSVGGRRSRLVRDEAPAVCVLSAVWRSGAGSICHGSRARRPDERVT